MAGGDVQDVIGSPGFTPAGRKVRYLTDVLERLATTPSAEIERLTPRDWKSAQQ